MKKREVSLIEDEFFETLLKADNQLQGNGARASIANFRATITRLNVIAGVIANQDAFSFAIDPKEDLIIINVYDRRFALIAKRENDDAVPNHVIYEVYPATSGQDANAETFKTEEEAKDRILAMISRKLAHKQWATALKEKMLDKPKAFKD
jgi:hypothetical protein